MQKLTTDPKARVMQSKDVFHCCYNVQTAVDKGSHLIAEYQVTNCCTDKNACRQCSNKCTGSKQHKTVIFGLDTKYIPVRMYGSVKCRLNPIPENIQSNPFKHTLDRRDYTPKKVVLRIKENPSNLKEQTCLSEHPFSTATWYHGAHYLLWGYIYLSGCIS